MTAQDLAIKLIKVYVERGDTIASLKAGYGGYGCTEFSASIGGYLNGKAVTNDYIIVSRINNEECAYTFKLEDIYNLIKIKQTSLF